MVSAPLPMRGFWFNRTGELVWKMERLVPVVHLSLDPVLAVASVQRGTYFPVILRFGQWHVGRLTGLSSLQSKGLSRVFSSTTIQKHQFLGTQPKPVKPKGNQPWIFIGRTDAETEAPVLWPAYVKSQIVVEKDLMLERSKAGGKGDNREWNAWMASPAQWTSKLWVMLKGREAWRAAVHGVAKSQTWLSNWTITTNPMRIRAMGEFPKRKKYGDHR